MRKTVVFFLLMTLPSCAPFNRGTIDNRPDDLMTVEVVHPSGLMSLSNGQDVRLYGLRLPAAEIEQKNFITALKGRTLNREVSTVRVLAGDPPAVVMTCWESSFICGIGLQTWDFTAKPLPRYLMIDVAHDLLRDFSGALNQADFDHPDATNQDMGLMYLGHEAKIQDQSNPAR